MNLAHLHLLLNHWPIIGTLLGTGLFLIALVGKSDDLKQVTLALFALMALTAIPAFLTGELVRDVLRQQPGISDMLVDAHRGSALLALLALLITGAFAWMALWQFRRRSRPAGWAMTAVLVSALVACGLMSIAGNTGGAIRHPEILSGEPTMSLIESAGARLDAFLQYVVTGSNRWVWPVLEVFHFVGLALLVGATGVLNLRLLGAFKQTPAGPFHRFLPWGIAGFGINIVTGMLFFIGMPGFYIYNEDFHLKIFALVLAGAALLLYSTSAFSTCEQLQAGQDAPTAAKVLAASSLFLWIAVIVLGRYMPLFEDTLDPLFASLRP